MKKVQEPFVPAYIFFFSDERLVAYHLKSHKYFEVDEVSFDAIKRLNKNEAVSPERVNQLKEIHFDQPEIDVQWEGDLPSHVLHQGSRIFSAATPQLSEEEFVIQYAELSNKITKIPEKERGHGASISLPESSLDVFENISLAYCFRQRKTSREFLNKAVELPQVSNILFSCFAPIHGQMREELSQYGVKDFGFRRSSPSSTGLASCDAILWANHVDGLDKGLYSYNESDHTLLKYPHELTNQELIYAMLDQFWIKNLAAGIFIVNDMRRIWIKDRVCRGYIASHQECGHISQNILLTATALHLDTWISGSFRDDFLQSRLELPDYRFVSLFIGIGHGTGRALSQEYLDYLDKTDIKISKIEKVA